MSDENKEDEPRVQADNDGIAFGNLSIGGSVDGTIIFGNDNTVTTGYTSEQVAVLITQIQSTFQPKPFDGRCPYKGLDVFEEEDAELFFGREKLVDDLVSRVKDSRTVFVTGPSGSGKSSLVRAGLIHALKQGAIKGSERWLYATMKPGRDPLESLASAFSRLKSPELGNYFRKNANQVSVLHECAESALTDNKNQRLVLFIDQFEEVFTQIGKEEDRVVLLNFLTHAATIENGRVIILFSMRSDFVSNCATYPQLNALLNQQFVQIGAMQPEELVSAIAQPALRVGLRIDPDLIAQIINEMKGEPGALPLMQFALKDLFDSQQEKNGVPALILNNYFQRGGIHKALERHADDAFSKLSKNEQELARSIFSGLIEIGRGIQDTKRTALFDELVPANTNAADVESIVQKLADARLITTDESAGKDTVTISHEKLIDAWPWLKKLVNENRDVISLQNEIAADAKEWEVHQRDLSYLYRGARLANLYEQVVSKKIILSVPIQIFIEEGIKVEEIEHRRVEEQRMKELNDLRLLAEAAEARLQAERRARNRLKALVAVLTLLTVSTSILLARPFVLRTLAQGETAVIEAGPVIIGTNDMDASEEEIPQWTTNLERFEIDRYEVSNRRYSFCVLAGICLEPKDPTQFLNNQYAAYPVVGVTAFQANAFCRWLGMRLPTELEWERATRGSDGRNWPWGDIPPTSAFANLTFEEFLGTGLTPVNSFSIGASPAPERVFNLIGNVWEWTSSYLQSYYEYDPTSYWDGNPIEAPQYGLVVRGGAWNDNTLVRVTRRDSALASDDTLQVGIRCAKNP